MYIHLYYRSVAQSALGYNLGLTPLLKDKNGSYCYYIRCAILIVRVGGMTWPKNRRNSLPCTVRTSETKVVQSKGWLSDGCYLT